MVKLIKIKQSIRIMTQLIACVSTGKGTWKEVTNLMNQEKWTSILLITNDFGKQNFSSLPKHAELLVFDLELDTKTLRDQIKDKLKAKIKGSEVAVNFLSGAGKEHMALVSALIGLGVAIRFIVPTSTGIAEL